MIKIIKEGSDNPTRKKKDEVMCPFLKDGSKLYGRSGKMSFDTSAGSSGLHPLLSIYRINIYSKEQEKADFGPCSSREIVLCLT